MSLQDNVDFFEHVQDQHESLIDDYNGSRPDGYKRRKILMAKMVKIEDGLEKRGFKYEARQLRVSREVKTHERPSASSPQE